MYENISSDYFWGMDVYYIIYIYLYLKICLHWLCFIKVITLIVIIMVIMIIPIVMCFSYVIYQEEYFTYIISFILCSNILRLRIIIVLWGLVSLDRCQNYNLICHESRRKFGGNYIKIYWREVFSPPSLPLPSYYYLHCMTNRYWKLTVIMDQALCKALHSHDHISHMQ